MWAISLYSALSLLVLLVAGGSEEQELVAWASEHGAQLNVAIGPNAEGYRGLIANKDIRNGEVVLSIPKRLTVPLGSSSETAPELAIMLLREKYRRRARFGPHFASLPAVHEQLCAEALPPELASQEALGRAELEELVAGKQAWAHRVMSGEAPGLKISLERAVPGRSITRQEFNWAACMASSRSLCGPDGTMYLLPIIDMANHMHDSPHTVRWGRADPGSGSGQQETVMELVAGADIKAGEEVSISYGPLRVDEAALYYGFQLPPPPPPPDKASARMEADSGEPWLCAVDHANYSTDARPGKNDWPPFVGEGQALLDELTRLRSRLHAAQQLEGHQGHAAGSACSAHRSLEGAAGASPGPLCAATRLLGHMRHSCNEALRLEIQRLASLQAAAGGAAHGHDTGSVLEHEQQNHAEL